MKITELFAPYPKMAAFRALQNIRFMRSVGYCNLEKDTLVDQTEHFLGKTIKSAFEDGDEIMAVSCPDGFLEVVGFLTGA